jgi:hypothetical protein
MWNTMNDLIRYFGSNRRVSSAEWVEFWTSLSESEAWYFHTVCLDYLR